MFECNNLFKLLLEIKYVQDNIKWIIAILIAIIAILIAIIAILMPIVYDRYKISNSMREYELRIEGEIKENYVKIKNIGDPYQKVILPDGIEIQKSSSNAAIAKHVKTETWEALMPSISIELQKKYEKIYLYTDAISDDFKVPDQLKPMMLYDNAKSFLEEYQKLFED